MLRPFLSWWNPVAVWPDDGMKRRGRQAQFLPQFLGEYLQRFLALYRRKDSFLNNRRGHLRFGNGRRGFLSGLYWLDFYFRRLPFDFAWSAARNSRATFWGTPTFFEKAGLWAAAAIRRRWAFDLLGIGFSFCCWLK